jgi:hypothetical protein
MENVNSSHGGVPLGKLVFGIVLLAVGILSFTDYLDITDLHRIWRFWPVLLIVGGLSSEIDSLRQRKGGGREPTFLRADAAHRVSARRGRGGARTDRALAGRARREADCAEGGSRWPRMTDRASPRA